MYTWLQFKAAVDALLLTDAVRFGTTTGKELKVKIGAKKLQDAIQKYRTGHQNVFLAADLSSSGFASSGTLPEDCEPVDCWIIREKQKTATVLNLTNDTLTVTAHGLTVTSTAPVQIIGEIITTGTLPGGVVSDRSYYLRVIDANTLSLHTSPTGAVDNTDRVDITSNGTGTHTLKYQRTRFPVERIDWKDRFQLIEQSCFDGRSGLIAIDPTLQDFILFPFIPSGQDANGFFWKFELNWNGVKLEWNDSDPCPFDDAAVEAVYEFVASWFREHVDRDLPAAAMAMKSFKSAKADAYLKGRRQAEQRAVK